MRKGIHYRKMDLRIMSNHELLYQFECVICNLSRCPSSQLFRARRYLVDVISERMSENNVTQNDTAVANQTSENE